MDILAAFAEFSKSHLPEAVHARLSKKVMQRNRGHNSRDSTAIEAREKPLKKELIQK